MPIDNKLLDDIARVAGGAVSLISTVRKQVESDLRGRVDYYADRMDLAPRVEIERLQAQVAAFRAEQEGLKRRIADLEAMIGGQKKTANQNAAAPKKPAAKKTALKSKAKRSKSK